MVGGGNICNRVGEFMEVLSKLCDILCFSIADNLFVSRCNHKSSWPFVVR